MNLEERIELLEFQVELLFSDSDLDRYLFECKVTRQQYQAIMDLMDSIREKLDNGEDVNNYEFENEINQIVPQINGDYHFAELIAKLFAEEGRWAEVFPALYGHMAKYGGCTE